MAVPTFPVEGGVFVIVNWVCPYNAIAAVDKPTIKPSPRMGLFYKSYTSGTTRDICTSYYIEKRKVNLLLLWLARFPK